MIINFFCLFVGRRASDLLWASHKMRWKSQNLFLVFLFLWVLSYGEGMKLCWDVKREFGLNAQNNEGDRGENSRRLKWRVVEYSGPVVAYDH
ncbi:hypothetical protein CLU79DRAFT_782981 [Phycomyces nitens]|nr:hypothetical protein CLU79DRAFT_782981 [Phycomyces nitens]